MGKEWMIRTLVIGNRESELGLGVQGSAGFGGHKSILALICLPWLFPRTQKPGRQVGLECLGGGLVRKVWQKERKGVYHRELTVHQKKYCHRPQPFQRIELRLSSRDYIFQYKPKIVKKRMCLCTLPFPFFQFDAPLETTCLRWQSHKVQGSWSLNHPLEEKHH